MLNWARWTTVLGSLGPVTVLRCVMEVLMMLYKLWTVFWRSRTVFVCASTQSASPPAPTFFRAAPPLAAFVWCPSVVATGDEQRHPCADAGRERGIQSQILHVEAPQSPVDLQISLLCSVRCPRDGHRIRTCSGTCSGPLHFVCSTLWPLFAPTLHKHAFFPPHFRPPQQHVGEGR